MERNQKSQRCPRSLERKESCLQELSESQNAGLVRSVPEGQSPLTSEAPELPICSHPLPRPILHPLSPGSVRPGTGLSPSNRLPCLGSRLGSSPSRSCSPRSHRLGWGPLHSCSFWFHSQLLYFAPVGWQWCPVGSLSRGHTCTHGPFLKPFTRGLPPPASSHCADAALGRPHDASRLSCQPR